MIDKISYDLIIKTLDEIKADVKKINELDKTVVRLCDKVESMEEKYGEMKQSVHEVRKKSITKEQTQALLDSNKKELLELQEKVEKIEKWKLIRESELKKSEDIKGFFSSWSIWVRKHILSIIVIVAVLGMVGAWLHESPIHNEAMKRITKIK